MMVLKSIVTQGALLALTTSVVSVTSLVWPLIKTMPIWPALELTKAIIYGSSTHKKSSVMSLSSTFPQVIWYVITCTCCYENWMICIAYKDTKLIISLWKQICSVYIGDWGLSLLLLVHLFSREMEPFLLFGQMVFSLTTVSQFGQLMENQSHMHPHK